MVCKNCGTDLNPDNTSPDHSDLCIVCAEELEGLDSDFGTEVTGEEKDWDGGDEDDLDDDLE